MKSNKKKKKISSILLFCICTFLLGMEWNGMESPFYCMHVLTVGLLDTVGAKVGGGVVGISGIEARGFPSPAAIFPATEEEDVLPDPDVPDDVPDVLDDDD